MTILGAERVLGIIRYRVAGDLIAVAGEMSSAGVGLLEITLDTPGALEAIEHLARDGLTVGAGTVLTPEQVNASADAGAAFVVSPALVPAVIETALARGLEPIPGALSPTEILAATAEGASVVKVFPAAAVGGAAYIRALRGPFPEVALLPTGGIDSSEVTSYLLAGATCVGLGSQLVGSTPPVTTNELAAIGRRAAAAVQAAHR